MANPTLDEFLSAARVDNPGVSDGQLAGYWLKTYANSKTELPKPEATAGGLIRSFGSSAIDTVGSAFQGGGEVVAAGARALTGNQDIRAANPLRPVTDAIRSGMSENDKLASQDSFKGDITSPSTIELPKTAGGWAHAIASGFGSLSSMILPGAMAATGARGMIMAGAATGALTTGGAAADDVRQGVQKAMEGQTPEQLAQSVPAYRQARLEGMDDGTARQKVENDAAILATTIAGAAGAVGGAFNAKVLEDVVAKRGLATLLGKVSASRAGQIGIGAGVGTVAEGLQEGLEKVGQNVGENIGLGRPAMENATRDTAGDVIMGGMIGGVTGGVAGAVTQRRPEEVPAAEQRKQAVADPATLDREQRKQAIQDIATAPDVDAAITAFGEATKTPIEFDRLGALGMINAAPTAAPEMVGPEYPLGDTNAIPYDYSIRQNRFAALPAPEFPTNSGVLINDTDPELTRPEQFGDRETRINATQRAREEEADAPGVRDIVQTPEGPRRRARITLDEAGNIIDAPDGDRQFLSLVRREARPHAAAAIEAHSINPALTEAALAAPDMGPKAERTVFEAIINGNPADQQTRSLLERYGIPGRLADGNGQGAQPVNPAASGQQPAGDQRQPAAGQAGTDANTGGDNRDQGIVTPPGQIKTENLQNTTPERVEGKPITARTDKELRLLAKNTRDQDQLKAISDELARRKREVAPAQPTAVAPKPKNANMVIRQVRDRNGNMLGTVMEPYDGTIEGARKAAEAATKRMYDEFPDAGNVASRMGATDENGNPKWAISPNFAYINPVDSLDGRATFGDADAIQQVYGPKVAKDVTPAKPITKVGGKLISDTKLPELRRIVARTKIAKVREAVQAEIARREELRAASQSPEARLKRAQDKSRKGVWRAIVAAGGISEKEAADLNIDPRSLGGYRMSGLITKNGMRSDILAEFLFNEGYLSDADMQDGGDSAARQFVQDMLAGEFVGTPEQANEYHALLSENHDEAAIDASGFDDAPIEVQAEVADFDVDFGGKSNVSDDEFMRAIGFDAQEIEDARKPRGGEAVADAAGDQGSAGKNRQDEPAGAEDRGKTGAGEVSQEPAEQIDLRDPGVWRVQVEDRIRNARSTPRVRPGYTRIYRAEPSDPSERTGKDKETGRYWTTEEGFARDYGDRLYYMDVPAEDVSADAGIVLSNKPGFERDMRLLEPGFTDLGPNDQVRGKVFAAMEDEKYGLAADIFKSAQEPAFALGSQTSEDLAAQARAAEEAQEAADKAAKAKDEAERQERVRKEIAARSVAAAGEFQLGQTQAEAEATLAGQGDIFSQPAAKAKDERTADEKMADFRKMVAEQKANRARLEAKLARLFERDGAVKGIRKESKYGQYLLLTAGMSGTPYRVTSIDDQGPSGHRDYNSIAEAANEFISNDIAIVDGPAPKVAKPVTPQVASASMLKTFIGIAADSIEQLRKVDVERVLTSNPKIYQAAIAQHIKDKRPDLADEVDAVLEEVAPAQEKGAAEPKAESVSQETPKDEPLASRSAPTEAVADMFGYTDADEDALLLDMDAQERAEYEKSKPRGMSWLDHAKQQYARIKGDYRSLKAKPFVSATYGADLPWQESARNRDGDALRALRSEAVRLEKDAPARLYINQDGTARITVFDARDVPKRMLAFAERNNLKTDVVVSGAMLQAGNAMPEANRASGAKYAVEMATPDAKNPFASRPGYTAPYRDLDAARFTVKTSKTGMPVYLSRTMALSNAREKDAFGVPKGGRALAFDIFDRRMKDANGMARKVGMVLVHQDADGKFVSLRNIQIDPKYREQGYYHGEGVIAGMLLHNGTTPMEVFNIQSAAKGDEDNALPFWKTIGTTILNNSSDPDVIIEGNISLARYMSAGEKRANYGQSSRDSREQPISRRDEARVGESNARRVGGDQGRGSRVGRVDAVRAELTDAFGEAGVAALEREGILQITTWDNAPKNLTDQLQSGDHGAYWPSRKTAYIFADNLAPGQAVEVLLHEIGEHYGLKDMLGDRYDRTVAQVKTLHKAGNKAIVAAWKHVERNYDLEPGSPVFMQEVIAKAGQSADVRKMAWWQRLIADIKAFLIKVGLKNVTSERDLGILLRASVRKAMRDAKVIGNQASSVMAARAFHGTPHNVDRFSTDKIGTGEGAQAYGWGLYFAENEGVARGYQRNLSDVQYFINDRPIDPYNPTHVAAATVLENGGDVVRAAEILRAEAATNYSGDSRDTWMAAADVLDRGDPLPKMNKKAGALYQVDIPDEVVARMLDWDRPLSEQPANVRAAIRPRLEQLRAAGARFSADPTGEMLYKAMGPQLPGEGVYSQEAASKAWDAAGVPGIRYLDAGSRNRPLREIKKEFLAELPEDADFEEVNNLIGTGTFSPQNDAILKALDADDWLGFDYPAQALSAALSKDAGGFEMSPELRQAINAAQDGGTRNLVVFNDKNIEITHKDGTPVTAKERADLVMASRPDDAPMASRNQTSTPAFKAWFGDSKIVDANGRPLVVYHRSGPQADFESFVPHKPKTVYRAGDQELIEAMSWDMGNDGQGAPDAYHYMAISDAAFMGAEKALEIRRAEAKTSTHPDTLRLLRDLERLQGKDVVRSTEVRPSGDGSYFTPDPGYSFIRQPGAGAVYPVYLRIENPLYLNSSQIEGAGLDFNVEKYRAMGYDGAIFRSDPTDLTRAKWGEFTQIVIFDGNQAKSAISNNGNFDPNEPGIMASRPGTIGATWDMLQSAKTPAQARALAMNLFDNPNKFNLWDKTIGTQLTKARKNEYFRAVFDALQAQQDSTAAYAIEAEAEAADVLARMEGMGEIKSALKSTFTGLKFEKGSILPQGERARDLQAVSKAIFSNIEGEQGVKQKVFTDAELAKDFGLNDRQIALYRQSRAAIDRSLDRYAQSLAVRMAQKFVYTGDLHRAGLDDTVEALTERLQLQRQVLEDQKEPEQSVEEMETRLAELEELRDAAPREILRSLQTGPDGETRQEFVGVPDTAAATALEKEIRDVRRSIERGASKENAELDAKIEALDAALSKLPEIAEQANSLKDKGYAPAMRFGDYAVTATQGGETVFFTMVDTKTQANLLKMRLAREMPGAELRVNPVDRESFKLFGGVDPATVELFARFMEVEENDAFKAYIALATSSRSALKHMLERKGIAGFSDNLPRVMAAFITSNSRAAARNIHGFDVNAATEATQKNARGDVSEEAAKLVNYMNNPTGDFAKVRGFMFAYFMGGSVSSALVNLTQPLMMTTPYLEQFAGKKIAGIMVRASKAAATGKVEGPMKAALARAEAEGITDAHEYHQLMQEAEGGGLVATRALMKSWGSMFGAAERFNRRITFLAAFETGQGMTREELSKQGVGDAYEFAKQAVAETQGLYNRANRPNWARNPVGALAMTFKQFSIAWIEFFIRLPRKQQLMALGLLILMAGIEGLPFAEDLEDLIDTIGQRMGRGTNSKKALRQAATNILGETGAQFALHGISGLAGMPMDVAGRLGMGNLIPGTKLLNPSIKDKGREVLEIVGPAGGLAQKGAGILDGNVKEAMPKAFADAAKAWEMLQTGEYRDTRGRKVMDVDGMDSLMKMIGFQPRDVAANTRFIGENMRDVDTVKRVESEIAEQWADGIRNKDVEESRAARERLQRWNEENPDLPIKITFAQVLRRARQASLTRDERFMKTVPPELRRRMLAEAVQ